MLSVTITTFFHNPSQHPPPPSGMLVNHLQVSATPVSLLRTTSLNESGTSLGRVALMKRLKSCVVVVLMPTNMTPMDMNN